MIRFAETGWMFDSTALDSVVGTISMSASLKEMTEGSLRRPDRVFRTCAGAPGAARSHPTAALRTKRGQ